MFNLKSFQFTLPSGDRLKQAFSQKQILTMPQLSARNQQRVNQLTAGLDRLTADFLGGNVSEAKQAASYRDAFFEKLRGAINEGAAGSADEIRSDLAKRFGGTSYATFGNDLLARVEKNRLNALSGAKLDAEAAANQLLQDLEHRKLQRIQTLQGQLSALREPLYSVMPYAFRNAEQHINTQMMREALKRQQAPQPKKKSSTLSTLANIAGKALDFIF